jgi:hypothetical protein
MAFLIGIEKPQCVTGFIMLLPYWRALINELGGGRRSGSCRPSSVIIRPK